MMILEGAIYSRKIRGLGLLEALVIKVLDRMAARLATSHQMIKTSPKKIKLDSLKTMMMTATMRTRAGWSRSKTSPIW